MRALAGTIFDRTVSVESAMKNHGVLEDNGEPTRPRLGEITAPTLVLHGTDDPLFPYGHGEALAAEIPGARLVPLEGVGHKVPPPPGLGSSRRRDPRYNRRAVMTRSTAQIDR